jgi:methionyl-tRNA synthetase
MYIRLDKLQPRVEEWVRKSWAKGKWSPNAVINADGELVDARLRAGLRPSPVTRDLKWGIPVPVPADDPDQDMSGKVLCALHLLFFCLPARSPLSPAQTSGSTRRSAT